MISPELLRRYPFFALFDHNQLREIAMITDSIAVEADEVLFEIDSQADALYLLVDGSVDLHYVVEEDHPPYLRKDFVVGTINPGELIGLSAIIAPHQMTSTAIVTTASAVLKINAMTLRQLGAADAVLECKLYRQVSVALKDRLHWTRVQLAAATA